MNKTIIQHILLLLTLLVYGAGNVVAGNEVTDNSPKSVQTNQANHRTATVLKGDANSDGLVTVADITAATNKVHGYPPASFNEDNCDVNGDGIITIADIVGITNIIHYGTINASSTINDWVEGNTEGELQEQEIYAD